MSSHEDMFAKAFMQNPTTMLIYTHGDGTIIAANEGLLRNFGFTGQSVTGKTVLETGLIREKEWHLLEQAINRRGLYNNIEIPLYSEEGEAFICLLCGHRIELDGLDCVVQTINNITVRRWMEDELLRSKNLETISILAGGIAHDFNNLLSAIMGNISMAKLAFDNVEKIHRTLNRAEELSIEAAELAGRLLTFAEGGIPVTKEVSIINMIQNLVKKHSTRSGIHMELRHTPGTWAVQADENQLEDLLESLIQNAEEAISDKSAGNITLATGNIVMPWDNPMALKEGNYVKITIRDNGRGIEAGNLDHIFAPYYTTKDTVTGGGVGLGLSICQSIVKKHDGYIGVSSTPGQGTEVNVYLGAYDEELPFIQTNGFSYLKGSGRVLVMDDERYIAAVTEKMLNQIGYEADLVPEGNAALSQYRRSMDTGKPYDAVILNLSNKVGPGGEETLEKLQSLDPSVKAIASSGYLKDSDYLNLRTVGFHDILKKPYSIDRLSQVLHRVTRAR